LPAHIHVVNNGSASLKAGGTANALTPEGNYFGENTAETKRFSAHADAGLANAAPTLQNIGGNQSHDNMQPYLVLNFCIALVGIFPSQN
jgi:microcystin-dependent protein